VASTQECSDDDPVLIGGVFNLSGPTADSGQFGRDGLELAASVINTTGGILGRCVETIIKDDGNDPTKGAQAGSELIEREGVDLIVGPIVSPSAGPILEISTEAKVPMALNALLPLDYTQFPYAFRTNLDVNQVAESFTRYASDGGLERLAVLAVNNVFGTAQIDAINEYAPATGIEVVATELFNSGDADLTPVMRKLQDADPDAIVLVGFGGDAVAALTARETLGMLDVPVLGFSAISLPFIAESVGDEGMQGVYVSMQFRRMMREPGAEDITDERAIEFREAFANFRGEDVLTASPTQTSSAYDAAMLLASAANGAGSLDADEIKQFLYENGYSGVQADYTFSEGDHDGVDLADNVLVLANSLSNGSMEIAPGQ
jgi:branched-chain amino acid transport system substrate-binding protein